MTSKWLNISFPFTSLPILKPAPKPGFVPVSVNWFPHRVCNYRCDFCFHTATNDYILPLDEGKRALRLLADAGHSFNLRTSGKCSSFAKKSFTSSRVPSCATARSNNWEEDMNDQIQEVDPIRWKVFQVLLLDSENTGPGSNSLRDARHLTVTGEQYQAFLDRHAQQPSLVPEDNNAMKDSYLLLDEKMRFLDCSNSGKKPGRSILDVGVETALLDSGFDEKTFLERGGIFEWTREPEPESVDW
ncbi:hypothetical protein JVT61DRAFT_7584 [Boletus reticuloceps]|uniref:Uncharacterized protein n=1 Tax=Boletus reticuloceps TaxID=495285 RepID=A0A8I3A5Z4_9AGAM|nr:hypothetical protein JVT61DRAFT_7584 [Boletus reticuloceps]